MLKVHQNQRVNYYTLLSYFKSAPPKGKIRLTEFKHNDRTISYRSLVNLLQKLESAGVITLVKPKKVFILSTGRVLNGRTAYYVNWENWANVTEFGFRPLFHGRGPQVKKSDAVRRKKSAGL